MTKITFERQDLRRLWLVLGAIESLDQPTLTSISAKLEMQVSTVQKVIDRINSEQLPGVRVIVAHGVYSIKSWGILEMNKIVRFYLNNA